jgi:SAM-dependent methyltransferase
MSEQGRSGAKPDQWDSGAIYESYVGRWSRLVARKFLNWLNAPPAARWLDVGCGAGALSQTILNQADPAAVKGVDRSDAFVAYARDKVADPRASFEVGDAGALPFEDASYDAIVSGLVLNFVPDQPKALGEMIRVAVPGGVVAAYVWDYAGRMDMMRDFWDAAVALNPEARELDEGRRFPICQPEPLAALFEGAGLNRIAVRSLDIPTHFRDFADYWTPFLGGQGPAPGYVRALSEADRTALRDDIRARLPYNADGSVDLIARAWAVRGYRQ